jgi:hypothetical protein
VEHIVKLISRDAGDDMSGSQKREYEHWFVIFTFFFYDSLLFRMYHGLSFSMVWFYRKHVHMNHTVSRRLSHFHLSFLTAKTTLNDQTMETLRIYNTIHIE